LTFVRDNRDYDTNIRKIVLNQYICEKYKRMEYNDLEKALSKPRIGRFLIAAKQDKEKALILYRQNIELSKTLFGLLSVFEVTIRNYIDKHYSEKFADSEWLKNQCGQGGMFSHPSFIKYGFEPRTKILTTIAKLGNKYTHDRLVAELSFGFWNYMFAPIQFLVGGQSLHKIYENRPKGTNQKLIFNQLDEIRSLRNRIAHHEPLIFNSKDQISTGQTEKTYGIILKHTEWLGFDPLKLYHKLDNMNDLINMLTAEK
jgi:hypothetical protein